MLNRSWFVVVALALVGLPGCDCVSNIDYSGGSDGSVDSGADGGAVQPTSDGGRVDAGHQNSLDGGPGGTRDGGPTTTPDGGCPVVACNGQCGPVRDFCSGQVLQCGNCGPGLVCDLVDHLCEVPALNCQQLGAECGQIRNSCGARLNCGACPSNEECDRNTHQCVSCSNPTCGDLGYECGNVWLGCGPFSNTTNCGSCGAGSSCNTALHRCEPNCTPAADAVVCAAASATCGLVSNGCGGIAQCGTCASGTECGARGIGNRCDKPETPQECIASNRNCGLLTSSCGGTIIDCGICEPGGVCSVEGVCTRAPTCNTYGANGDPKSPCSNGLSASFPGEVGSGNLACPCDPGGRCNLPSTFTEAPPGIKGECCVNTVRCMPNECNATKVNECTGEPIVCSCTAANTHCNNATHACEANNDCLFYTTGAAGASCSNGPSSVFPNPAGGTPLICPCAAPGAECFNGTTPLGNGSPDAGTCCVRDTCPANSCGTIVDHCSGQTVQCSCATGSGTHCNGSGTCIADSTCASLGATGVPGAVCSNGPAFSNNGQPPVLLTCPCNTTVPTPTVCTNGAGVVSGGTTGTCCQNTVTCGNQCNVTLTDSCTGAAIVCGTGCGGTGTCSNLGGPGTCTPYNTCADHVPPATGGLGAPCSTSNNTEFPQFAGDPTGLTCNCTGGRVCSVATPMPHVAGSGEVGACCQNTASCNNTCGGSVINTCTGAAIPCTCTGATHCASGMCVPDKTCSDYGATGAVGAPCSDGQNSSFPGGPNNQNLACSCAQNNGFANNTCIGATSSTPGACSCTPSTPANCGSNGQSNGCGGTMVSTCGSNQVCFQNACCNVMSCGPRNQGDACGMLTSCGQPIDCACTQQFMTCGAMTPGVCGCRPKTLADCGVTLPPGQTSADGCGGFVTCPG